ncbi:hypothetical protein D3C77_675210 [compost metagenome]
MLLHVKLTMKLSNFLRELRYRTVYNSITNNVLDGKIAYARCGNPKLTQPLHQLFG